MTKWTWRDHIAYKLHLIAYWIAPDEGHLLQVKDAEGRGIFSVAFSGVFEAAGPTPPYSLECAVLKEGIR